MGILKGVEQGSAAGPALGPRKRHRNSNSPAKATSLKTDEVVNHVSPTLQSSSIPAEDNGDDGLDWPTSGPFTFHRWHVLVEK